MSTTESMEQMLCLPLRYAVYLFVPKNLDIRYYKKQEL